STRAIAPSLALVQTLSFAPLLPDNPQPPPQCKAAPRGGLQILVVNRRLGRDAERRQVFKDAMEPIVARRRGPSGVGIAAPYNRYLVGWDSPDSSLHAALLVEREGAELGRSV
ncbi:MAG: hypothetical protein ACM3JG_17620, partial [Thiohalocapsa sp.]